MNDPLELSRSLLTNHLILLVLLLVQALTIGLFICQGYSLLNANKRQLENLSVKILFLRDLERDLEAYLSKLESTLDKYPFNSNPYLIQQYKKLYNDQYPNPGDTLGN